MITTRSLLAIAATLAFAASARALTPDQIAVIVNTTSDGSKRVADHYLEARHIPKENLLTITVDPAGGGWSESNYREQVVRPLRQQLKDKKLEAKIQCLVTTYDVPLTVPAVNLDPAIKLELAGYRQSLAVLGPKLESAIVGYEKIATPTSPAATVPTTLPTTTSTAPSATTSASAARPAPAGNYSDPAEAQKLVQRLAAAAQAALQRVNKLPAESRNEGMRSFVEIQQRIFGPAGVLPLLSIQGDSPEAQTERAALDKLRQQVADNNLHIAQLLKTPSAPLARREVLTLRIKTAGLMGEAAQTLQWISDLQQPDTSSSLDNELALLWEDNYPKTRWVGNPYCLDVHPYTNKLSRIPRVLLISRLDGLTPDAVIAMIDTTLRVEKTGLTGVCYFDARGLANRDSYTAYDADIRKAADYLRQNSSMKIVLENTPELLKAENAPDAALYCGWYALRKYTDSCQWNPGFVGYHVASLEMLALHNDKETGWVPNLLRHQCAGTLGAVEEPYLQAFPKPSQFFPLLMTGELTMGEVYFVTNPLLSWRIGFVGDPLYNPFAAKPVLASDKILANPELKPAYEILRSIHLGPASPAAPK